MKECLRIAIAQINPIVGDLEYNRERIDSYIEEAKSGFADIIVFPELAVCGYPPEDLLLKKHFVKDNIKVLNSLVKSTEDITAIIGFADIDKDENVYNAAAVVSDKKIKAVYRKIILPNYGVFDEKRYFQKGDKNFIFNLGNVSFGVNICEDIWDEEGPYLEQAKAGAKLIFNISASPFHTEKGEERYKLISKRAKKLNAFISYTNLVGGQDEIVFDGRSFLVDPKGQIVAAAEEFSEELVLVDVKLKDLGRKKSGKKMSSSFKKVSIPFKEKGGRRSPVSSPVHKKMGRLEEIYNALVLGTRDYVLKNGFEKVVLGLSGGIDSSLTCLIAHDALGKDKVIGLSMPSEFTSDGTKSDARKLAENLGIKFLEIPINGIFNTYFEILGNELSLTGHDITEQNLQARIRGNILMAFSNRFGWLVLTTGNKSETAVGYCTLYGDMAGGYAVIKDVPKTLVYELAEFVNKREKENMIPVSVIEREPSAELAPNQKDTDSIPPYDLLDKVIRSYIEEDKSFDEIKSGKITKEILKKVINMVDRNEYKRRQAPAGIKITPKAFGRDRRMPITNRYREMGK